MHAESSLASSTASETSETGCSPKALEFIDLFNEYRKELGLDSIPPSDSLCFVSDTHAKVRSAIELALPFLGSLF